MAARRRRSSSLNRIRRLYSCARSTRLFFAEKFDHIALLPFQPTEQRRQGQMEGTTCGESRAVPRAAEAADGR
jgi:hypothetical protein